MSELGNSSSAHELRRAAPTLALLMGGLLVAFTGWEWSSAASQAGDAASLLAECHRLAGQIDRLQTGPAKAEVERRAEEDLAGQIEGWFQKAGVDATQILRIEPITPRRVADSNYLEQGARVEVRSLTLSELASFVAAVEADDPQLAVTSLRVTAPRAENEEGDSSEPWQAELALTYLLYAPKSSR